MIMISSSVLVLTKLSQVIDGKRIDECIGLWNSHIYHGTIFFDVDEPITCDHILILMGEVE